MYDKQKRANNTYSRVTTSSTGCVPLDALKQRPTPEDKIEFHPGVTVTPSGVFNNISFLPFFESFFCGQKGFHDCAELWEVTIKTHQRGKLVL